jgi:hypothetical protein
MLLKIVRCMFVCFQVILSGCTILDPGDASYFVRMNSQFIPGVHAGYLWSNKTACERYKSGVGSDTGACAIFERDMTMYKKACEETRSGIAKYPNPSACEVLDIYEVKYKNMPAPVSTRPDSPGDGRVTTP